MNQFNYLNIYPSHSHTFDTKTGFKSLPRPSSTVHPKGLCSSNDILTTSASRKGFWAEDFTEVSLTFVVRSKWTGTNADNATTWNERKKISPQLIKKGMLQ
mmetsp:Transcript_20665/g.31071  ORF Transcript_20665/g.31071 Transcript_20665/m.31071 type:complete len:101 (+) Transcript_20665:940-1242(+)